MVFRSVKPLPRRLHALAAVLAVAAAAALPAGARADCPGAEATCPYVAASQIGQTAEGVMRFPQALAIGPDGSVFVADQGSHVVQVFGPDGVFRREFGIAGSRPGQLSGVGAIAVAGDSSVLVADGANRIDRFDANGQLMNSWGGTGSDIGEFRFGAGAGNSAAAGGGLAVSGDFVYVADTGNDRVQRFTLDGGHGAEIVPPGTLANPRGVAVRRTRLFVADDQHHRLVVFDTGGHFLRAVGQAGSGPGQLNFPYGVATDAAGRVFVADDLNHRVVRFSSGPLYPYKGRWGSYGTAPGQLAYPRGIAVDAQGNVYVANTGNDRIDVFDKGGALLRSFGTSGRAVGQFDAPVGVAADAGGIRAVTDSVNGRLELLNADGSPASSWGSPAPGPTILPNAVAVAFDAAGNAYVLDRKRSRIVAFSRATGLPVRTIGSPGSGPGQLQNPSALTIDAGGTIVVADSGNERIARFSTGGSYLGATTGVGDGRGIAVTPDGQRTYVSTANHRIEVFDPSGSEVDEFGGQGSKLGKLESPGQITLDAAGNLWVADRGNNRIQEFGPAGERLLAFGQRGAALGEFVHPSGVSIDCHGLLTVTDSDNNRVQQFALAAPAVAPCAAPIPIGNPPAPKLPTLPAPLGPQVTLRVLRSTGLVATRNLPLRVGCDTTCTVTATATVTPTAAPPRKHRRVTVALATVKLTLGAGDSKIGRPTLSKLNARRLVKALRGRRGLQVNVMIAAQATTGEPAQVTKRVSATR
ncbi:MAG: NHL repeat-containing protein [Solirubrobacteraceae bacterium]